MYRTRDKNYDWMDLRSHRLYEFHRLSFQMEATEYSEAYVAKGLLVSQLYWGYNSRPMVRHCVAGRRNYRLFNTDEAVDLKCMKEEELAKVKAGFENTLSLEEYLSKTEAALLKAAEEFEMALLEGDAFPDPKEICGYDSYRMCITGPLGTKVEDL